MTIQSHTLSRMKNPAALWSKVKSNEVVNDDPVLDEIVSKLKSECYISKDNTSKPYQKSEVKIKNFGVGNRRQH